MKKKKSNAGKYVLFIVLLGFAIWAVFEYLDFRRYQTPIEYGYQISEEIDIHYHNQLKVQEYYSLVYELETFANAQWMNFRIDVRFADQENPQSVLATKTYTLMMSNLAHLEAILKNSKKLKDQGFDNDAIAFMEETGVSPADYAFKSKFARVSLAHGDIGKDVEALQSRLNEVGYSFPVTGYYLNTTERSITDFQEKNNLFPSGVADQATLKLLFPDN